MLPAIHPSGRKRRILVVDDNIEFSELLISLLGQREGYEVRVINDPAQALATARKFAPDLILLDMVMPGLDGGDVRSQFRAAPEIKDVPVIFLTSIVDQSEVDAHQGQIGGDFFLAKSVRADRLVRAVAARFGA